MNAPVNPHGQLKPSHYTNTLLNFCLHGGSRVAYSTRSDHVTFLSNTAIDFIFSISANLSWSWRKSFCSTEQFAQAKHRNIKRNSTLYSLVTEKAS
jgi:hypothetical protein